MIKVVHFLKIWLIDMSYYAVGKGRFPGVYFTWADCKKQVDHFPGAKYKKFDSEREARDFVNQFQKNSFVNNDTVSYIVSIEPPQLEKQNATQNSDFMQLVGMSVSTADQDIIKKGEELSQVVIQKQLTQLEEKHKILKKRVKSELAELREKFQMLDERLSKIESRFLDEQNVDETIVTSNVNDIYKVEKIFDEEFGLLKEKLNSFKDKKINVINNDDTKTRRQKLKQTFQKQNIPRALGSSSSAITTSSFSSEAPSGKRKFSSSGITEEKTLKVLIKNYNSEASSRVSFILDDDGYVIVYTDGACEDNGRRGARAGIGVWFGDNHPLNISEPVVGKATNNMAEIQAATYAVETAKKAGVKKLFIHTDSKFLINCITEWINKWKKNDWRVTGGEPVKNKDELIVLDNKLKGIEVKWKHVRGHCGLHGNEMADHLAREGAKRYVQFDCDEDF